MIYSQTKSEKNNTNNNECNKDPLVQTTYFIQERRPLDSVHHAELYDSPAGIMIYAQLSPSYVIFTIELFMD